MFCHISYFSVAKKKLSQTYSDVLFSETVTAFSFSIELRREFSFSIELRREFSFSIELRREFSFSIRECDSDKSSNDLEELLNCN